MTHADIAPFALQLARHVHQAAEIAGKQGRGPARNDIGGFLRDDCVGYFSVFDGERAAESAADVRAAQFDEPQALDGRQKLARLARDAQLPQARAGIVVGDVAVVAR